MVELGLRSEALLNSHTFRFIVEHIGNGYADNILTSAPHEKLKREDNYHMHRALNDIVSQLSAFVLAKDQIMQEREAVTETTDQEEDD